MSYSTETFLAHHLRHLRGDIFGGVTVAVVALPLSLAFGVASGAGPMAGLYGAILLGFFAAVFGGCPPQISGPTGPMVVVMAALITQLPSNPQAAFTAVLLAGAFQLIFGVLRLGSYITYVPFPVVSGFMSGVGCLIIVLQLGPLLGHPGSDQGVFKALAMLPEQVAAPNLGALAVAGAALAVMLFLPARLRRLIPPPLLALLAGTGVSLWLFPEVRVIGPIPHGLPHFVIPSVDPETFPVVLRGALALALLGAIDSVLTSLIADSLTRSRHDPNREMLGQGIGNAVCGL
ncbi:MAG: SulP family inorganic anion transporter, partial [Nitrospirota bacterium]|nr:SulP family inorganic anion transporter [Nitrospirota bacterium]